MTKVKVLLADDHKILLETLHEAISMSEKMEVVATVVNGEQVLQKLRLHDIDVLVCDVQMPVLDGISTILRVKESYPKVKILMLSMLEDKESVTTSLQAGADGFVMKKVGRKELERAILAVAKGQKYFDQNVFKNSNAHLDLPEKLTPREIEVLKLLAEGKTSTEMAESLNISLNTVETHRKNIFRKLQVKNQAGAIHFAIKYHLID